MKAWLAPILTLCIVLVSKATAAFIQNTKAQFLHEYTTNASVPCFNQISYPRTVHRKIYDVIFHVDDHVELCKSNRYKRYRI
ncbi:hypothetical protein AKO1_001692 [Acrasis kona]|uniref:Uncharacterized protein n=1 Tax=Acrasis kona TaxID=1008807 RepID=A0AAW2ZAL2_9EUKA